MSDLAARLENELIALNHEAQRAAATALLLNHPQAEALRMDAALTERLVKESGPSSRFRQ